MPIEFFCPGCGQRVRTPDEMAGRKGRCPHCQVKVLIPVTSLAQDPGQLPKEVLGLTCDGCQRTLTVERRLAGTQGKCTHCGHLNTIPREAPLILQFTCGDCGMRVRVSSAAAGKRGQCPHCRAILAIPRAK